MDQKTLAKIAVRSSDVTATVAVAAGINLETPSQFLFIMTSLCHDKEHLRSKESSKWNRTSENPKPAHDSAKPRRDRGDVCV
jgi:hypothetical protein